MRYPMENSPNETPDTELTAIHVMRAVTIAHRAKRPIDLETLARELDVRKTDVRSVVSKLHAQGFLDAMRMRPTMLGLTLGLAAKGVPLRPLRQVRTTPVAMKAA